MKKFCYLYILQGRYGFGWEDLTASETRREMVDDKRTYQKEECGQYRIIRRRELNDQC